jgi:hypothetical protein
VSSRITIKPTPALGFGGLIAIIVGVLMILGGGIAWAMVSQQLASENIYVAKDAPFFADRLVNDPLSAYAQAEAINKHALEASGGKTYAELAQDDPTRQVVMNAAFLRSSLFTSVVSFGVAALAMGTGLVFVIIGWALRRSAGGPPIVIDLDSSAPVVVANQHGTVLNAESHLSDEPSAPDVASSSRAGEAVTSVQSAPTASVPVPGAGPVPAPSRAPVPPAATSSASVAPIERRPITTVFPNAATSPVHASAPSPEHSDTQAGDTTKTRVSSPDAATKPTDISEPVSMSPRAERELTKPPTLPTPVVAPSRNSTRATTGMQPTVPNGPGSSTLPATNVPSVPSAATGATPVVNPATGGQNGLRPLTRSPLPVRSSASVRSATSARTATSAHTATSARSAASASTGALPTIPSFDDLIAPENSASISRASRSQRALNESRRRVEEEQNRTGMTGTIPIVGGETRRSRSQGSAASPTDAPAAPVSQTSAKSAASAAEVSPFAPDATRGVAESEAKEPRPITGAISRQSPQHRLK